MSSEATSTNPAQTDESAQRSNKHAASDSFYHPFSSAALQLLPKRRESVTTPAKAKRTDRIPETDPNESGVRPLVRDYHSITQDAGVKIRVPKKIATPVKVEAKVWFANERTWISYLSVSVLLSTLALGLYNASRDPITTWMAYLYAVISIATLGYGYWTFQKRLTMISARDASQFEDLYGPLAISAAIFVAILVNFILRVTDFKRQSSEGTLMSLFAL